MNRRRFLTTANAAVVLMLTGRDVVAQILPRPLLPQPLLPWSAAGADHADPRIAAMAWAVLAPSAHNRQPWALRLVGEDAALLFCDPDRRLPVTDPFDRQILISLGCFAELFRLAAAQRGLDVVIEPFPQGEPQPRLDGRPVARITLRAGGVADPLFAVAARRRSAKVPYDMTRALPAGAEAGLRAAMLAPAGLGLAQGEVSPLRDLVWRAWMIEAETPAAHQESVDLMRLGSPAVFSNPDGISIWGPQFDPMVARGEVTAAAMLPGGAGYGIMVGTYRPMLEATPAYVWLTTHGNSRADQLAAGRDWLRLNLATTAAGLALHPVSQALQEYPTMDGPRAALPGVLGVSGHVQMLGRLGYASRASSPTPRWPAESRILAG